MFSPEEQALIDETRDRLLISPLRGNREFDFATRLAFSTALLSRGDSEKARALYKIIFNEEAPG